MPEQETIKFPKDFLWGAATSAYQVEGGNSNSDWWEWEKRSGLKEVSGDTCRHYALFKEDFALAQSLSHNAHRLSIEWSRIQPRAFEFSQPEINHYREVIANLKSLGIEPIVTLHHFTNPLWLAKLGGWESPKAIDYFLDYVWAITGALSDKVNYWVTINEPNVYVYHSYILGEWPPEQRSFALAKTVRNNLITAHVKAYKLIHNIYKKRGLASPLISIAQNMQAFVPCQPGFRNVLAAYLRNKLYNFQIIERLHSQKTLDFIGINYYSRTLVEPQGWSGRHLFFDDCKNNHHPVCKNSLGWDIYPQGLYAILMKLKKYRLPVFILENGICTSDDALRWDFIRQHLQMVYRAMASGVKILGYIYWSLLDNYEWDKGFAHRFGLIEVDYKTCARKVRASARLFAEVCKSGKLI
jgi:beta-glucosidase